MTPGGPEAPAERERSSALLAGGPRRPPRSSGPSPPSARWRGDVNKWSDVDVLVVAEPLPATLTERLALLRPTHRPPGGGGQPLDAGRAARLSGQGTDPVAGEAVGPGVVHGALGA